VGHNIGRSETDTLRILAGYQPGTLVVQDKREWECRTAGGRGGSEYAFRNVQCLKEYTDVFKLTVLKDAHQQPAYHRGSAEEMGVHAWVVYYDPAIMKHLAPYIREKHCIRTHHCVDPERVPAFSSRRSGCILSGAISKVYPLRERLLRGIRSGRISGVYHRHPGYGRGVCATNDYLQMLSRFRVAFCTTSTYGYAVRKIIEAMACGCLVVTDLPKDDVLPKIDEFLVRVSSEISTKDLGDLSRDLCNLWNPERQRESSERTKRFYSYKAVGLLLAQDIEKARQQYRSKTCEC
jgi:hypothetical protein